MDQCTATIQPAGSAGNRNVFLTLRNAVPGTDGRQIELVLPENAARILGEALISGSIGIMRDFDFSSDGLWRCSLKKGESNLMNNQLTPSRNHSY